MVLLVFHGVAEQRRRRDRLRLLLVLAGTLERKELSVGLELDGGRQVRVFVLLDNGCSATYFWFTHHIGPRDHLPAPTARTQRGELVAVVAGHGQPFPQQQVPPLALLGIAAGKPLLQSPRHGCSGHHEVVVAVAIKLEAGGEPRRHSSVNVASRVAYHRSAEVSDGRCLVAFKRPRCCSTPVVAREARVRSSGGSVVAVLSRHGGRGSGGLGATILFGRSCLRR
mmetsp:Transcript_30228/g.64159  ORF Transcript_30228/g.64159 Transcript_30228/m.64159 type:complete len:225 (+) Transcript_30228:885-1559(+)